MINTEEQIQIIQSLFKCRTDVFALRWEKGNKSGYSPSLFYDPYRFRIHKMNGGTFENFGEKSYNKLTEANIQKHLEGYHQIGVYPLQLDNSSCFIVADFDKMSWQKEAVLFLNACKDKNIPAYLERSRSGNGGHVWIFFQEPYPAIKSRKIFKSILEHSGAFSMFDKTSSFDRLFPNQDYLTGKGFGNLIALPLNKKNVAQGNGCFIDSETFEIIENQWDYLSKIKKVTISELEVIHNQTSSEISPLISIEKSDTISIILNSKIILQKLEIPLILVNFIKDQLNFANSEFVIKKNSSKNTFNTHRYFNLIEEKDTEVHLPRGFIGSLIRFCKESAIKFKFFDDRKMKLLINYNFSAILQNHQNQVIETVKRKDFGIIVAPPGAGKTVIGLKIIALKQQPALIIVHRKQLLEQWIERIEAFLDIPKKEIGVIGQGKTKIGEKVNVATIQSLKLKADSVSDKFGIVIVDECHHIPAEQYKNTIEKLKTFYLYGLTATPIRKYNDAKIIFTHLGDIIANIEPNEIENYKHPKIIVKSTEFHVPFNSKIDNFESLSKILIHDTSRNNQIIEDVKFELEQGKKIVLLTERKEHIEALNLFLNKNYNVTTLSGDDSDSQKKLKWKLLSEGNFQILITTGQYFGEGTDIKTINCLFLVYPFSFVGKLIQYIGRVQRSEITPTIYDYRDLKIEYLNRLYLRRNTYYRKIQKLVNLFDDPQPNESNLLHNRIEINRTIKIFIDELEFHYGSITFKYFISEIQAAIEFQIENWDLRPEFEVLKTYFAKVLNSKYITVEVVAEFENQILVSQIATSPEIQRITKEVIESVKFQFLNKEITKSSKPKGKNLLTLDELQEKGKIYSNGNDIIEALLKSKNYKHSKQIQYLAERHENITMKIRFVLHPFSFVFLVANENFYYIILETLDTEEASYIWKCPKNKSMLIDEIARIENNLELIREKGRQAFLENAPINFNRIVHDYSDSKKGFSNWKATLEERI